MAIHGDNYWLEQIATGFVPGTTTPTDTMIQGASAAGTNATTNPVLQGAVTRPNANKVTRTNGQTSNLITDENENLHVREAYAPLYEDNVAGVAKTEQRYISYSASAAGTFTIKAGAGFIQTVTILGGTAGAITVYDNTAGSGTTILPTFTPNGTFPAPSIDVFATFSTGLTIVTAAATVIQVSYR